MDRGARRRAARCSARSRAWNGSRCSRACVAAVAAFAVAGKATRLLHRGDDGVVVPVGLVLVASVAVVWDFSTSGLEMGLVWLWIAASWYVLVSAARVRSGSTARKRLGFGVVLGLAPLVRPDLALMMLCFLVAWFVLVRPRRIVFDLVAIFALPRRVPDLPHGLLRHARAHDRARQGRGRTAPRSGMGVHEELHRAVPVVADRDTDRGDDRRTARRRTRPPDRDRDRRDARRPASSHALYITAIGGDYMHGRLLLPAFFALALPASIAVTRAIAVTKRTLVVVGISAVAAVWAIFSVVAFRPPPNPKVVPPQPDQRLARGVGRKAPSDRHAVRSQRRRGGRRVRPRRARLLQARPTRRRARGSIRTRSC